jgi:mannose-1-phosphate guanylyltransferase
MDSELLEKAKKVAVVPAKMEWSDLGNWDSIYEHLEKMPNKTWFMAILSRSIRMKVCYGAQGA